MNCQVVGVVASVLLWLSLFTSSASGQTTWFVDDDTCPGVGDGSAGNPFCLIQDGIDAAVNGDEVVVALGIYIENINPGGKAITITSTDPGNPDVVAATIIDAAGAGRVVTCASGEGPDTVLSGFTITGGSATNGAGMQNSAGSSPTVSNCTFIDNAATNNGGGMRNNNASPTVINCTFIDNAAGNNGGGMQNGNNSSPTVTNCTFTGNMAGDRGGGIHNINSNPTVTNCTFSGNVADSGGGISNELNSSPTVTNCTFSGNVADFGGGMGNITNSNPMVTDCTFDENTADLGGGMRNNDSDPTVTNCTFSSNSTITDGGGMHNGNNSSPTVTDCTFSGNGAGVVGGGMENTNSSPTVTNCTFSGNVADFGGGMGNVTNSNPTVTNCTFSGNSAGIFGGGMYNNFISSPPVTNCILWGDSPDEIFNVTSTPVVSFSDIQGGLPAGTIDGGGNIDVDPLFIDADGTDGTPGTEDDNLRLNRYSLCTDAADNTAPDLVGITEDLDGNPRFVDDAGIADTGVGPAPIVDMGAYERQTDSVPLSFKLTPPDSIQEVIDDPETLDGDEIILNMGTYNQTINLMGKAITIRSTDPSDPAVVAATIIDAGGSGRVVLCNSGEGPDTVLSGFTITGGNAPNGAGMRNLNGSSPTVTNCTFSGNSATSIGGGMENNNGSNPTVTNCTFSGNMAAIAGGGMGNQLSGSPTVTNCMFSGNMAGDSGGGMFNFNNSKPMVTNCTFSGNVADVNGGGMINVNGSNATVTNCILWGDSPDAIFDNASTPVVTFSDVQGGYAGADNIDADPLFIDPDGADDIVGTTDDNLRLPAPSPCIDVGDNVSIPPDTADLDGDLDTSEPTPFDLDGNPRVSDGNLDGTPTVDMGAYELDKTSVGFVLNLTQATIHDTIAEAITAAIDGDELLASVGAFVNEPDIDFNNKALTLRSNGDITQAAGGLYAMTDDVILESAAGQDVSLNGELRVQSGDTADVITDQLITGATSLLSVRPGASLFVTNPGGATLGGETFLLSSATLGFTGDTANAGDMILLAGTALVADSMFSNTGFVTMSDGFLIADSFLNDVAGQFIGHGEWFTDVTNDGALTCIGDTTVVGDYTNNGTTIVQIGTLTIIGTLINNGTIIGDVQTPPGPASGGGTQPGDGLAIAGDYIAGPDAALIMPDPVWRFSLGGHYDVAITDNNNYHMIDAELRMAGGIGTQNLELMSLDIGADSEGLDPSFPGHYPIGTLRIGPGPVIVNLVDAHDNDGQGQTMCEAIYVQQLIIEPGATLNTLGCRVYYVNLINNGTVDDPANLIPLPPACPADLDADGSVGATDLLSLLVTWGPCDDCKDCPADLDGNCTVGGTDLLALLVNWGPCP